MSLVLSFIRSSSFCAAIAGVKREIRRIPRRARMALDRGRESRTPLRFAYSSLESTSAAAPSLTPGALPAVIGPTGIERLELRHRFERCVGTYGFVAFDEGRGHVARHVRAVD